MSSENQTLSTKERIEELEKAVQAINQTFSTLNIDLTPQFYIEKIEECVDTVYNIKVEVDNLKNEIENLKSVDKG